jgi:hypothetical protein
LVNTTEPISEGVAISISIAINLKLVPNQVEASCDQRKLPEIEEKCKREELVRIRFGETTLTDDP